MNNQLTNIEFLSDQNSAEWNSFVSRTDGASIYHLADWAKLIEKLFGHQTHYLLHRSEKGNVDGVLPLVRLRSRLFGDYQVSMPYFNYGGVLADNEHSLSALNQAAFSLASKLGVSHLELRQSTMTESTQQVRTDKVVMLLELPDQAEILWTEIGSKCRAQVKRPLREGVQTVHGRLDLLDDFYQVFAHNMRDLGTPVYPKSFFRAILKSFPDRSYITVVRHQGKPVATAFLLGWHDTIEIPWASSLREVNRLGVNMLLYWEVLKRSIEMGYKVFDFGRSTKDTGTYRFKKQWGAKPHQLYWYYWLNAGQSIPELTPHNPRYKLAIALWQRLPVSVTKVLGPYLVKNLP